MKLGRVSSLVLAAVVVSLQAAPAVKAQDYPSRQITLIAPWPARGAIDALCRLDNGGFGEELWNA